MFKDILKDDSNQLRRRALKEHDRRSGSFSFFFFFSFPFCSLKSQAVSSVCRSDLLASKVILPLGSF